MRGVGFFDIDGTLVAGDSGVIFATWCLRRGLLTPRDLAAMGAWVLRAATLGLRERDVARAKLLQIAFRQRVGEARADALYEECFRTQVRPRLRPHVLEELRATAYPVLVTANLRDLALRLAQELDIPAERCLGAEAARGPAGELLLELRGPVPMGEERARLVVQVCRELGADPAACAAYGDSRFDVPMLQAVGAPCAVHPDRTLRKAAYQKGWRILER